MKNRCPIMIRRLLASIAISAALAFQPVPASACCGAVGADGYTRAIWHGTDGSISIWKLDSSLNLITSQNYGPYNGWDQISATIIGNNYYILWKNTDGAASIWLVNANLAVVSTATYGPVADWLPEGLGVDGLGNLRLFWDTSGDQISAWVINEGLEVVGYSPVYGPYFGWVF
jgi:hypothetical protein